MIYLVDIGNTRLKYITLPENINSQEHYCNEWNSETKSKLANEISEAWLTSTWLNPSKIIIASVNQTSQVEMIHRWADKRNIPIQVVKSSDCAHGVVSGYRIYEQLGVDRWLALIGAHHRYPKKHSIIVDAGTATTVDVLTDAGLHQGGWILPGIELMRNSIISGTANVISENRTPSFNAANNTVENVSNACWAATLGLINIAIMQLNNTKQSDKPVNIIFTGGNGKFLHTLFEELQSNYQVSATFNTNSLILPSQYTDEYKSELIPELIFYGLMQYIHS